MLEQVNTKLSPNVEQEWRVSKIKVLLLSIHYPLAMKSYFERALRRRDDVDLITCGPYTSTWIPWMGGMSLPPKYAVPPTIPLPFPPNIGSVNYEIVKSQLSQAWIPDIVLTIDAGIHWKYKPTDGVVVHVATDPHALNYDYQRTISDKFFNMQKVYSKDSDIFLPYAYDPTVHFHDNTVSKDSDAVLVGMPYEQRVRWVEELRRRGVSVLFENGPIFDEYRQLANRARIGLNWSSLQDMNARVFEIMAMGLLPVMNRVPDLGEFFQDGVHYLGFDEMEEAVSKVVWAKEHESDAKIRADQAHQAVKPHTYDARVEQILRECRFV